MNVLYPEIKFSKLVTNIGMYISIVLFSGINEYNLKQTLQWDELMERKINELYTN